MVGGLTPRRARLALAGLLAGFLLTLLLTLLASLLAGQKLVVVGSGSAEPVLSDGDLVVERQASPSEAKTGDLITFSEPGSGRTITHRVQRVEVLPDRVLFLTRGDSSPTFERFSLPADGEIGVPIRRIPFAGDIADLTGGPAALVLLALLGAGALAAAGLSRRARPAR